MTAVSQQKTETAYVQHPTDLSACWTEQGCIFEIRSSDKTLMEMAQRVFVAQPTAITRPPTRSWTIERVGNPPSRAWIVSGTSENSSMLPVRADTRDVALLHVEYDAVDWLLNNSHDAITVHAALLSRGGKGIVIVGPSFAGKSTLAIALWRNGWSLLCDDTVFIDTVGQTASPAPRRVSLRHGSRELVGEPAWKQISNTPSCIETAKGLFFHPHEVSESEKEKSTALSAIFFLARMDSVLGEAELKAINPAKGALSLLPYAFNARILPFVEGLRKVTPLLETVPAYDLGRGDLKAMVDAVEATVG